MNTEMAEKTAVETKKASLIETSVVKQKQKLVNLSTGQQDDVEITYTKFSPVAFDPKVHGSDKGKFLHQVLADAQKMVQPIDSQIEALLKFAGSESYDAGKTKALAGGNYLTQEIRSAIVEYLRMYPSFAEKSAKDIFDGWLGHYTGSDAKLKKLAQTVLDRVNAARADEFADLA